MRDLHAVSRRAALEVPAATGTSIRPMALGSMRAHARERVQTLPARHGGVVVLAALALIVALGFGLRLESALNPDPNPGGGSIVAYQGNDALAYEQISEALYETGRYGTEQMKSPSDWSPGGPFFYAGVYFLTGGADPENARIAVAILGAAMVLLVYLIGRRLAGPVAGLIGALLAAIYPAFIDNNGQLLSEPIAAALLAAAVLSFLWAADRRRVWAWVLPGLFLGATALTRPEYLPFAAVFALIALVKVARTRSFGIGLASSALLVGAFVLVLAPWTVRNYVVLDRFVPVTTGGGKALFVATYLPGKGRQLPVKRALIKRFTGDRYVSPEEVQRTEMKNLLDRVARKYPDMERDAALARIGRENFRKYVRERPVAYARMVAVKMWNVWRRGSGPTMRASGWIAFHYALLAFAIVGLGALAWRRRWETWLLASLIAGITVLGGLLLAVPRRNVPLMPLVFALAAVGAVWLALLVGGWLAERRHRTRARRPSPAGLDA
jgi:4-amino-4-deoxy-L-arabinose transferase-like glycosyltransferase